MTPDARNALIERYAAGPAELETAWNEVPEEARTFRPAEGEWSAHEIVVHCADSETYAATRIRLLVAEPSPVIVGYDQEVWVDALGYDAVPAESALAVVSAVRSHTAHLLRRLDDEAWGKVGEHTESGRYSALDWLESYGAHLHDHAAQIRANLEAWATRPDGEDEGT
jgi:hypothetical protein